MACEPGAFPSLGDDEGLGVQIRRPQGRLTCKQVVSDQRHANGFTMDDMGCHPRRVSGPGSNQGHIQPSFGKRVELSRRLHGGQAKLDRWKVSAVFSQQAWQRPIQSRRCDIPNLDLADLAARGEMTDLLRPFQLPDGSQGFGQEQPSSLGEGHGGALATIQKTRAKRLFQRLDLLADGGLRHVQPVSSAREVEFLGDGDEIAELASVKHGQFNPYERSKSNNSILDLHIFPVVEMRCPKRKAPRMNAILPNAPLETTSSVSFALQPHPMHPRLQHVALDPAAVQAFLKASADVDIQNLEYVPFMRHILAGQLEACAGPGFGDALNIIARDRRWGGFTIGMEGAGDDEADMVRFGTAVAHLLGPANHDLMSGKYYAGFTVRHTDDSDSYLRQAYRPLTLHTDGTFVSEATDWLLMMKLREENASGGESRLLHIDDWEDRERFRQHPFAHRPFRYKAPGSKNADEEVERPVFFESQFGLSVSFIDQFVQPRSRAEASYLHELSTSMEKSKGTQEVPLPKGQLVVVNNYFWLHGRGSFQKHPALHRELMRQRGAFQE